MPKDGPTLLQLGDEPIDGTPASPDRLGRQNYADYLVKLLERIRMQGESSVMAMIGPWGAGKSSVLDMTIRTLATADATDASWTVARFNPWSFNDLDSLQLGFFATLRGALPKDAKWSKARQNIGQFGRALSPIGKLASLAGVDAEGAIDKLSQAVIGDIGPEAVKEKAEKSLRELKNPVLIVLDDVDRLDPGELLLVLKLVRQIGRMPNVYYLLCYDERTLLDVLMRTDLVGSNNEARARDYMEKIVQVRLDLPVLRESQIVGLIDSGLTEVLHRNSIVLGVVDRQRLSRAFRDHLHDRLRTPRAVNRLLAQVDAFYSAVAHEVDFVDFFCITWLRTQEPMVYALAQRLRGELTGTSMDWVTRSNTDYAESAKRWHQRLGQAGVEERHTDGVLAILGLLFLPVRSVLERMEYSGGFSEQSSHRKGVGHIDYFDRYFAFKVPDEDIPDSVIAQAMDDISNGQAGVNVARLRAALGGEPSRILRKIRSGRQFGHGNAVSLMRFLASEFIKINDASSFIYDQRTDMSYLAADLLQSMPSSEGIDLLKEMCTDTHSLSMVVGAFRRLRRIPTGEWPWANEATATVRALLKDRVMALTNQDLTQVTDKEFQLIRYIEEFDSDWAHNWLREQVSTGRWDALGTISRLVPAGWVSSGEGGRPALGDLDMALVASIFDIDVLLEQLSDTIDSSPAVDDIWSLAPTPDNRVVAVLNALREFRAARDRSNSGDEIT